MLYETLHTTPMLDGIHVYTEETDDEIAIALFREPDERMDTGDPRKWSVQFENSLVHCNDLFDPSTRRFHSVEAAQYFIYAMYLEELAK